MLASSLKASTTSGAMYSAEPHCGRGPGVRSPPRGKGSAAGRDFPASREGPNTGSPGRGAQRPAGPISGGPEGQPRPSAQSTGGRCRPRPSTQSAAESQPAPPPAAAPAPFCGANQRLLLSKKAPAPPAAPRGYATAAQERVRACPLPARLTGVSSSGVEMGEQSPLSLMPLPRSKSQILTGETWEGWEEAVRRGSRPTPARPQGMPLPASYLVGVLAEDVFWL